MAAVTIYKDNNLEYIVLPQRKVLAKTDYGDLHNSLTITEKSAFWQNKGLRERIKKSGDRFFKVHSKELDSLDMGSSDGSMSDGFFLYLTYYRFQNQQYTAYFINDRELNQLTRSSDIKKSDDLAKLLTLETALEYLLKMKPGEKPEYGTAPPNTPSYKGKRGGNFYYHSEVGTFTSVDDAIEDIPIGEEIEREVIAAEAAGEMIPWKSYAEMLPTITKEEVSRQLTEGRRQGWDGSRDKTPVTPGVVMRDDEGNITSISTPDGHMISAKEIDPKLNN